MATQVPVHYFFGYVSEVTVSDSRTSYDLSGFETLLQNPSNASVQLNCYKRFGSAACGVLPVKHLTAITAQPASTVLSISDALPLADLGRYQFGKVRILAGPFAGYEMDIEQATSTTTLQVRGSVPPANFIGYPAVVLTGCRKTYQACLDNGNDRHIGFPGVPGTAFAFSAADAINFSPTT